MSKKKYAHLAVGLILALLVLFAVPEGNGLTAVGVRTLAVIAMTVYYWIFVGTDWVSLLAICLFAIAGTMPMKELIGKGLANTSALLIIFTSILCLALNYCGFMNRLITWFISRNVVRKRPWVFLALYYLAIYIIACFCNITSACLITLPVGVNIIQELGYSKEDKFSKVLLAGSMWCAMWGYAATPIGHPVALAIIGLLESSCGIQLSFFQFMTVGIPITLLMCVCSFLIVRFIIRPDMSKYVNYNVDAKRKELTKMEGREKATLIVFLLVIAFYFIPDILRYALPDFYSYTSSLTLLTPSIIGICVLVIITIDGAPLLDFKKALKDVSWSSYFILAGMFTMSGAVSAESTGITAWLGNLITPLTANMTSWVPFILLIAAAATILTNFMSCNVVANMMFLAAVPLMASMGDNLNMIGVAMVIAITANAGVMTPQASGAAVVYLSSEYLTPAEGFKYGSWVIPVFIIAAVALIYPLCGILI